MITPVCTITRRMDSVLNDLQKEFKSLCTRRDFEAKMRVVKNAGTGSDRASKLRKLFDMFDACGIAYERGRENAYYETLIQTSHIPDLFEMEERMVLALYVRYQEYATPGEYMLRTVNRLSEKKDPWSGDPLRLRILKQFIKYGNFLEDAGYGGKKVIADHVKKIAALKKSPTVEEVLLHVDDKVFSALETASKAQKKPEGKYGLLKLADDLASGKFRAEGGTKKGLYLFAMVYGMTYYSGRADSGELHDYEKDLEINLFQDYYSNNLTRFISDEYREKRREYEADPSGQGINYKNFAEMIYLYFISQQIDRAEKVRLSSEMIRRVQDAQFKKSSSSPGTEKNTVYYKGLFFGNEPGALFSEDILCLCAEAFEQFILSNYDCDTYAGTYHTKNGPVDSKVGYMQLHAEQNTAAAVHQEIIQAILSLDIPLEQCNYGLWFTDVAAFKKSGCPDIRARLRDIDEQDFDNFIALLQSVNDYMGCMVAEEASNLTIGQEWKEPSIAKTKALYLSSPNEVTRTSIIVAFYYYYNASHEQDGRGRWKNFEELFHDFKREIDGYLIRANYQTFSGKNLLDVLVAFSSYAYQNI